MKTRIVNLLLLGLMFFLFAGVASAQTAPAPKQKQAKALTTRHTIKTANPVKRMGLGIKNVFGGLGQMLDAAIVDPIGIGLQAFADTVDKMVAAPLESMPEPFELIGDGVHYVYLGVDKIGVQLAK